MPKPPSNPIFNRIQRQNLQGKKPPLPFNKSIPPTIPELEALAQEEALVAKALDLEPDEPQELNPFLNGTITLYPSSTNIYWIRFFPNTGELLVQYHSGGYPYLYASNLGEAKSFLNANSKGKWGVQFLRPRACRRVPASYSTKWQI